MVYHISYHSFHASILQKGAELCSFKRNEKEYIWQADPTYWDSHGPLLFPIVGRTKNDMLQIGGQECKLPTHGFLSSLNFEVLSHSEQEISLIAKYDEDTLRMYPFPFQVIATYTLSETGLSGKYDIYNLGSEMMPYGFGLHNGFYCLDNPEDKIEDVYLAFDSPITINKPTRSSDNFMDFNNRIPVIENETKLWLKNEWYPQNSPVIDNIDFHHLQLCHKKHGLILDYSFSENFELFNPWRQYNSPFICLEPWSSQCGIYPPAKSLEEIDNTKYLEPKQMHTYWFKVDLTKNS